MATLYIVATPIGNLEDMTFRAVRTLKEVSLIAAEDTRTSKVLLKHYEISTPTTSYHEHNKHGKANHILDALEVGDVALISDAGTPGISDPGYELINSAIQEGHTVVPIPGANAVIPALVVSGLPTDSFVYLGFLPKKKKALKDFLRMNENETRTMVTYENPYRLVETLISIREVLGERRVCVAREITKMFEEFFRGTVSEAITRFTEENPKGEITLVIEGRAESDAEWTEEQVREALRERLGAGESLSYVAKTIAKEAKWRKSAVYQLGIDLDS